MPSSWCSTSNPPRRASRASCLSARPLRTPTLDVEDIDHLVYATADVEATVERLGSLFGVRAAAGGRHPGRGTRNALFGLGPACYLEIIGPDPSQPAPPQPRWFGIDGLKAPRLTAWAVRDGDLEARSSVAAAAQLPLGPIVSATRQRPDGQRMTWRFTDPVVLPAGGVVPFFIDWGTSPHPADGLPQGLRLVSLRAEHPDVARVRSVFREFGLDVSVSEGLQPLLVATLDTPRGRVELS